MNILEYLGFAQKEDQVPHLQKQSKALSEMSGHSKKLPFSLTDILAWTGKSDSTICWFLTKVAQWTVVTPKHFQA